VTFADVVIRPEQVVRRPGGNHATPRSSLVTPAIRLNLYLGIAQGAMPPRGSTRWAPPARWLLSDSPECRRDPYCCQLRPLVASWGGPRAGRRGSLELAGADARAPGLSWGERGERPS